MKIYIWKYLPLVSNRYHSGGGAVVIAQDRKTADSLLKEAVYKSIFDDSYGESCTEDTNEKMKEFSIDEEPYIVEGGTEEKVIIFPDAGCC